jgi:hypothetical protein
MSVMILASDVRWIVRLLGASNATGRTLGAQPADATHLLGPLGLSRQRFRDAEEVFCRSHKAVIEDRATQLTLANSGSTAAIPRLTARSWASPQ